MDHRLDMELEAGGANNQHITSAVVFEIRPRVLLRAGVNEALQSGLLRRHDCYAFASPWTGQPGRCTP